MKTYCVGLSANDKFYGRMIRFFTKSKVNHSFIVNQSEDRKGVQVDKDGVRLVPVRSLTERKPYVELYTRDDSKIRHGFSKTQDYMGSDYDWLGIVGFVLKLGFSRLLRRDLNNPIHRKGELFCSEYVATVLNAGDITFNGKKLIPENTSPETLRKVIRKDLGTWGWRELTPEEYLEFGVVK